MGSKAQENCGSCTDKLPKNGDYATCCICSNGFHFDKCSIKKQTWASMGPNKQSQWACTSCRKAKKGSQSQAEEEDITEREHNLDDNDEVSNSAMIKSILNKVNGLYEMREQLNSIESAVKFFSEKYDTLMQEIVQLRNENKDMKAEIEKLKAKERTHKETVDKLNVDFAELDQYGRRMNLEIQGVKIEGDPKQEKIEDVLKKVAKDIGTEFSSSDIHQAHRLQTRKDGKPPTILIQFFSKTSRDLWLTSGRRAKLSNIYFNENLSSHNRLLLKEAKIRAKTHDFRFVWFRGGRVLVKKGENSNLLIIRCLEDLKKIK